MSCFVPWTARFGVTRRKSEETQESAEAQRYLSDICAIVPAFRHKKKLWEVIDSIPEDELPEQHNKDEWHALLEEQQRVSSADYKQLRLFHESIDTVLLPPVVYDTAHEILRDLLKGEDPSPSTAKPLVNLLVPVVLAAIEARLAAEAEHPANKLKVPKFPQRMKYHHHDLHDGVAVHDPIFRDEPVELKLLAGDANAEHRHVVLACRVPAVVANRKLMTLKPGDGRYMLHKAEVINGMLPETPQGAAAPADL
jgi:hypothetical protein